MLYLKENIVLYADDDCNIWNNGTHTLVKLIKQKSKYMCDV